MFNKVTKGYIKYKQPTRENSKGVFLWCVSYRKEGKIKRSETYLNTGEKLDLYVIAFKIWNKDINKDSFIDSYVSYYLRKDYEDKEVKRIIVDKSNYPEIKLFSKQVDNNWFTYNEKYLKEDFIELEDILKNINTTLKTLFDMSFDYLTMKKNKVIEDILYQDTTDKLLDITMFFRNHVMKTLFKDSHKIEFLKYIYFKINKKHKINFNDYYQLMGIDSNHSLWNKLILK